MSAIGEAPPPVPRRTTATFTATDTAAERTYLDGIYGGALTVESLGAGHRVRHRRSAAPGFAVDDITVAHRCRVVAAPRAGVMIATTLDGAARLSGGVTVPPGRPILADQHRGWSIQVDPGTVQVITVGASLLQRIVEEQLSRPGDRSRPLDASPATVHLAESWTRSVNYVLETLAVESSHLMIEAAGRVLAAAVLSCFAPAGAVDVPALHDPDLPMPLRRALFFVAERAREDIGVQAIAGAVHLSPRAVQYLFRKHLGETPTEHLRRVRLQRAHLDLVAGHPSGTTVSEVARRWGFSHTGRFAVLYRQTYGASPHVTLRGE